MYLLFLQVLHFETFFHIVSNSGLIFSSLRAIISGDLETVLADMQKVRTYLGGDAHFGASPPRYVRLGQNSPSLRQFLYLRNLEKKINDEHQYLWLNSTCLLRSHSGISIKWTPFAPMTKVSDLWMEKEIAHHSLTGLYSMIFHDGLFNISY